MLPARSCPLPSECLLARHCEGLPGAYTDAFVATVPATVSLPQFVEAFYSSVAFKPELIFVGLLFGRPWAFRARELAQGRVEDFSAWRVEARTADELLLREIISDRTRSWLKVEPLPDGTTRLYFGSAILPVGLKADGEPRMSPLFALVGLHRVYARVLLAAAKRGLRMTRLQSVGNTQAP